jgi:hypothetical protein
MEAPVHGRNPEPGSDNAGRGLPKLREHLGARVAFMKLSLDYFDFIDKLDQHYPRFGEQYRLPFPYDPEKDDGKGI